MAGPKLATMAWRNLWRQKRRTILTLASIAFGGFLSVLMTAMQDRSFSDFIDTAARLGAGHVVIEHAAYLDTPSLARTVQGTGALHEKAQAQPGVVKVVDRVMGEAMVSTAHDSFGAAFIAYDPAAEDKRTLSFIGGVAQGELYETADDPGIVLGKTLAKNLGAELGDKVVYTMMDKNGEIVAGMGRLSGTISTGAQSADAALFLLPIDRAREVLGYAPDEATHVGIYLTDNRRSPRVARALNALGLGPETTAISWDEIAPDLRAFIAMKKGGSRFFMIVIALLACAGIFNTLFMAVMERLREFGILLAIGYSPRQIFRLVMWESAWLSLVGIAASALITAWPYYYLAKNGINMAKVMTNGQNSEVAGVGFDMTHLNIGIYPEHAVVIAVCIVLATLAAGLYPAWKAGRVEPVESIKLV